MEQRRVVVLLEGIVLAEQPVPGLPLHLVRVLVPAQGARRLLLPGVRGAESAAKVAGGMALGPKSAAYVVEAEISTTTAGAWLTCSAVGLRRPCVCPASSG